MQWQEHNSLTNVSAGMPCLIITTKLVIQSATRPVEATPKKNVEDPGETLSTSPGEVAQVTCKCVAFMFRNTEEQGMTNFLKFIFVSLLDSSKPTSRPQPRPTSRPDSRPKPNEAGKFL